MNEYTLLHYHADRVRAAIASKAAANSALIASWRRSSARHKLDPADSKSPHRLTETELGEARQSIEPLLRVAQPSLDRLFLAVGSAGCCVLLADRNGVPVDRRGVPADDETFHSWGLWPGSVWSEDSEGTNGIGTCLVEQRALTIHRDQHFFARNTLLSCTTAPIYDHLGSLVAALDVSSCRADLVEGFINLVSMAVVDAAHRIEAEHFRMAFPRARILLAPAPGSRSGVLIAVDADDLVIGASRSARLMLGINQAFLEKPRPAAVLIEGAANTADAFAEAECGVLQRALAQAGGNVSAAAEALGISRATLHRKLNRFGIRRSH